MLLVRQAEQYSHQVLFLLFEGMKLFVATKTAPYHLRYQAVPLFGLAITAEMVGQENHQTAGSKHAVATYSVLWHKKICKQQLNVSCNYNKKKKINQGENKLKTAIIKFNSNWPLR